MEDIKLHAWQKENVGFIEKHKFTLIADEMGLGKTFSALAAVKKNNLYPCLILCPKSLKVNWKREIKRIDHYKSIEILDGTAKGTPPKQKNGRFASDYTILHYNSLKLIPVLPQCKSIILDEIHYLKGYKSKRTIVVQKYIREKSNAFYVIGLSGTPILNKGSEIFTVANVLHSNVDSKGKVPKNQWDGDGGLLTWEEFHGENDEKFTIKTYFRERFIGYEIKTEKLVELNGMLKDRGIMIRHTKSLLKDTLPPKTKNAFILPKPKGYQKELNRLEAKYGELAVPQLTMIRKWLAEEKVLDVTEYVQNIIDQSETDKVIVFGNYKEATNQIGKKLGVAAINSDTKFEERQPIIDKFQSDPNVRVLVMTVKTGNVGLNLVEANHVVFNDYSYSPSDMMQAEARIDRIGQTKPVTIHYMSSQNTVDEDVIDLLTKKQNVLNGIIDGTPYTYDERGIEQSVLDKLNAMMKSQKIQKTRTAMFKQVKNDKKLTSPSYDWNGKI